MKPISEQALDATCFQPDWLDHWTASQIESELIGFKFMGPGWYITKGERDGNKYEDMLLVLLDKRLSNDLKPGTVVRMSQNLKRKLRGKCGEVGKHLGPFIEGDCWACSSKRADEFGDCIGIVEGQTFGDLCPEVDVRWLPSNLRYAFLDEDLDVVGHTFMVCCWNHHEAIGAFSLIAGAPIHIDER